MNKKFLYLLTIGLGLALAVAAYPAIVFYLSPSVTDTSSESSSESSSEDTEPRYERVEAERYEIQFPEKIGEEDCYGGITFGSFSSSDADLSGRLVSLDDLLCTHHVDGFILNFYVYSDGSNCSLPSLLTSVTAGEYGRYVISDTQVYDEPVAYTLEPVYDYLLVE